MKNPIAIVKDKFGDKAKLIAAVEKFTGEELWIAKTNENKGLKHVSNSKLLRLHATFSAVKEKFGTRFKLVDAIVELDKRAKDEGYRNRLLAYPVPRLWDLFKSTEKRNAPKPERKAGDAKPKAKAAASNKSGAKSKQGAAKKPGAKSAKG